METEGLSIPIDVRGSRYRVILRLAMPTVVAMLAQSVVNEIDVVFFSRLPVCEGSNAQAALLPSLIVVWLFGGSLSAVSVGTQALTARRFAERELDKAGAVLANAAWFCLMAGAALSFVGWFLLPAILGSMIKVPEVRAVALAYSRWRVLGVISMAMTMGIKAFFDGIGKTHVHLVASVVMNACNVLFCWIFIYGNLGAPHMGATGAGMSAFIATWIGLAIMLLYAWAHRVEFQPVRWSNLSRKLTWEILRLSIPAALATIAMMVGFGLFSSVVGKLDSAELSSRAALEAGACTRHEAVNGAATTDIVEILKLTFTACIAFGTATATLVGQSLGAKKPDEAWKFGWASVRLGLLLFGVVGLCEGVLFTRPIVAFITTSEAVRAAAHFPMQIMGIVTPVISVALILSEALFGAGNPKFVALAQLLLVFGCLLPLAYVLGIVLHLGLVGIWVAACAYSVLAAVTMTLKFRGGAWMQIKL
jgi:MATE family multidrug resistance protein